MLFQLLIWSSFSLAIKEEEANRVKDDTGRWRGWFNGEKRMEWCACCGEIMLVVLSTSFEDFRFQENFQLEMLLLSLR